MFCRRSHIVHFITSLLFIVVGSVHAQTDSLMRVLEEEGVSFTSNNRIVFFDNGQAKFDDLFKAVAQAKSSVHMEYFNFRDDSIANALFELLAKKVAEGVEVRLLYDAFGNASNNRPIKKKKLKAIRETGIKIYEFSPLTFPWLTRIIPRDHRKIVLIDGKSCYSGGMNVADYYIKGKPEIGGWHDIHYRIEGDAVGDYQKIFLKIWEQVTHEKVSGPQYYPGESFPCNALKGLKNDTTSMAGKKTIGVVNREPRISPKVIRNTFVHIINSARHTIQLINPYFTLNGPVKRALKAAVRRGVRVEIMVSETSDIPITPRIVDYQAHQMMKAGAYVYYYRGGFHHSKIMMIDSMYCYAGSANLDSRSLRCDYECNALVLDRESTAELLYIFNRDKQSKCVLLTDDYWKKKKKSHKTQAWFYHLLLTPFV